MSGTAALEALFAQSGGSRPPQRRKRGRRWAIAAWIIGVLIVLLAAGYIILDSSLRSTAETVAATAVKQALPGGAVSGALTVHMGGPSVIAQYASGSFDDVQVDVHTLTVAGISAPAHITAHGVPTSLDGKITRLDIALDLDAQEFTALLAGQGTVSALGDGTFAIDKDAVIDGTPASVHVVERPSVQAEAVTLTVSGAQITTAPDGADVAALAASVRAAAPAVVCVADKLPRMLPLNRIDVTPHAATVTISGTDVALSRQIITEKGTC